MAEHLHGFPRPIGGIAPRRQQQRGGLGVTGLALRLPERGDLVQRIDRLREFVAADDAHAIEVGAGALQQFGRQRGLAHPADAAHVDRRVFTQRAAQFAQFFAPPDEIARQRQSAQIASSYGRW